LIDTPDKVRSRQDLVDFFEYLAKDLEENPGKWENRNLKDFLLAMASITETLHLFVKSPDADPTFRNEDPQKGSWTQIAVIAYGAKYLE